MTTTTTLASVVCSALALVEASTSLPGETPTVTPVFASSTLRGPTRSEAHLPSATVHINYPHAWGTSPVPRDVHLPSRVSGLGPSSHLQSSSQEIPGEFPQPGMEHRWWHRVYLAQMQGSPSSSGSLNADDAGYPSKKGHKHRKHQFYKPSSSYSYSSGSAGSYGSHNSSASGSSYTDDDTIQFPLPTQTSISAREAASSTVVIGVAALCIILLI